MRKNGRLEGWKNVSRIGRLKMNIADAQKEFTEVINRTAYMKRRTVITQRGKPLAAVVPIEDLRLLETLEQAISLREARAALLEADRVGTIPLAEVVQHITENRYIRSSEYVRRA